MGRNEKVLRDLYARYKEIGIEAVIPHCDENIVWRSPGASNRIETAGEWYGHDGAREYFEALRLNWTLTSMHLQEVLSADDHSFVARLLVSAASNATGKSVSLEKVDLITMRDGKITSYAEVFDTAPLERASRL
jgi:ketosteroid isomerase-like protein